MNPMHSSEENIRRAIQVAESVAPAILWIDEIDKALAGATQSAGSDGGTSARVFGTLLTRRKFGYKSLRIRRSEN